MELNFSGKALEERLQRGILAKVFSRLQFEKTLFAEVALTLDPWRFSSPVEALDFIRRRRQVSRFARQIAEHRRLFLRGPGFISVLHFTKKGWPHWHVLLLAKCSANSGLPFIPCEVVKSAWPWGHIWVTPCTGLEALEYLSRPSQPKPPPWFAGRRMRLVSGTGLHLTHENEGVQISPEIDLTDQTIDPRKRREAFAKLIDSTLLR